jgi:hypothetical protein
MDNSNYSNIISILKKQEKDCNIKAFLHKKSGEYYNSVYSILSIINITLLSITTISKIITDIYTDTNIDDIIFTVLIAVSTALSGSIHFLNYSELSVLHTNKSTGYTSIQYSIQRQLTVPTEDIQEYYSWVTKKYDTLILQSPDIPKYIETKYNRENMIENNQSLSIEMESVSTPQITKEEQYQIDRWIANE